MISGLKTSRNNKLFSINRQISEKISLNKKLNIPPNCKANELSTICLTPTKFQKYSAIYSKYKSYSKASTKIKTISNSKSPRIQPTSSIKRFNPINSINSNKFPSLISNFNNNILNPQTPNKRSRNIHYKIQKNSTMEKKINFDKFYPSIQNLNNNNTNNQSQNLLRNTMKSLSISYKKFFLNKKKIHLLSVDKNKNIRNKNKNNSLQNCKTDRIKKSKISICDEECSRNKFEKNKELNNKIIKSILNLKYIQNKIQHEFQKKDGAIMKKIKVRNCEEDPINEFSFNKDYSNNNNYYNDDDYNNDYNYKNNNNDIIDIFNKKERCNLIQSKLMKMDNEGIYEENYECDTPQFTTLDDQRSK